MFLVPRLRLLGAVAALLAAAVILGITAAGRLVAYQSALNLSRSPLAEPPPPGPAGARQSRRVTLVILDGLREDASRALPTLAALRLGGADLVADSHFPTLSLPNYVALLSGVPPVWSGVRTNHHPGPVPVDHLFARARDAGLSVSYLGDRDLSLGKLFPLLDDITLAPRSGSFARVASRGADLNVVLVLYPDDAGHRYGARASEYQSAALAADALLAEVVGAMDLRRDTLVVVSDHGHTRHGGHGGLEDEVRRVPLVLAGAGVAPHAHGVASLIDVAPTVAWLLGIPSPRGAHGSVLVDALALRRDERALAIAGDQARQAWVAAAVRDAQRRDRSRGERTRTERLAWIAAGAALIILLLEHARRRGMVVLDGRVLAGGLAPVPLVAASLAITCGDLSWSLYPDGRVLVGRLPLGLALAAVGSFAAAYAAIRRPGDHERMAAGAGVAAMALLFAATPALAVWARALTPGSFVVRIPSPDDFLVTPLGHVALIWGAAIALLLLVVEMIVYLARVSVRGHVRVPQVARRMAA